MTSQRRLEHDLPALLAELYPASAPDYRDDLVRRVARVPQRPAWTFPERWIPVDLVTSRAPTVRLPLRTIGVLALIGLLIAAALVAYVGSQRQLPAPFGVAENGLVAYVDAGGAILEADPTTGQSHVIVAGPGNDRPIYSPDGSKLAYLRTASAGIDIVVSSSDGGHPVVVTSDPLPSVGYLGWSPDNTTIVVTVPPGHLQTYDASTTSAPIVVSLEGQELEIAGIDDFNANVQDIFRPPTGDQILFVATTPAGPALYVSNLDGTAASAILTPDRSVIPYGDIASPQWSPDGTRIAIELGSPEEPDLKRIHVVNADGTGLRELSSDPLPRSESNPSWSPDGTRVAFQRWSSNDICGFCVTHPITVVGVDDGIEVEVGGVSRNGFRGWSWSPDGQAILQVRDAGTQIVVEPIDPDQPRTEFPEWLSPNGPNWQRVAP